ncbi:MAG: radical SAM protein [Patescibacteria group bacterium]
MKTLNLFAGYHFPMSVYRKTFEAGGITQLSLDFSSTCNYRCDWCFNGSDLNNDGDDILTLSERVLLLEDARALGARTLVVPGTGEPTLDPYFRETIEAAHERGLISVVYTNLTGRVDENLLAWMRDHGVSLGVKLDSFKEEHFLERYHTTKKQYGRFISNLKSAIQVYRNTAVKLGENKVAHRIIANSVLTRENMDELPAIAQYCEEVNLPLFVRPVKAVDWAKEQPSLWKLLGNRDGGQNPEKELTELANEHNTLFSPSSTEENHCAIFSFGLTVKNNGDVQLCPDHHASRGEFNVRKNSLSEIVGSMNARRKIESGYCIMLDQTHAPPINPSPRLFPVKVSVQKVAEE